MCKDLNLSFLVIYAAKRITVNVFLSTRLRYLDSFRVLLITSLIDRFFILKKLLYDLQLHWFHSVNLIFKACY